MPTPRKDYEEIKKSMGRRSAKEFVKASAKSDAIKKKMTIRHGIVKDMKAHNPDIFDYDYEQNKKAKHQYIYGKGRAKPYQGK